MIRNRRMTRAELEHVLDWAAEEGWNPGLGDAEAFHAVDPDGFFVAEADGAPVAAISVVNHGDAFAFLGLYLCHPDYRGRGIAHALWKHAMAYAGERTLGLDGVPDQQANYARSGFVHAGATTRFTGRVAPAPQASVRAATEADIDALVALEAEASGWHKPAYLSEWFRARPTRRTFVISDGTGSAVAAATARRCRTGAKIGPLMAPDRDTALALIRHAADAVHQEISIDVPSPSTGLHTLCGDLGLVPGFSTARMYRGSARTGAGRFFAVATLELG
jgi:GNAT superfamily N-acetyltransferase